MNAASYTSTAVGAAFLLFGAYVCVEPIKTAICLKAHTEWNGQKIKHGRIKFDFHKLFHNLIRRKEILACKQFKLISSWPCSSCDDPMTAFNDIQQQQQHTDNKGTVN